MDDFTLQIKAVCLVSILTGVLGSLIPSCRLKKSFNSFCAVVVIFAIMMPFSSLKKSGENNSLFNFKQLDGDMISQSDTAEKLIYTKVVEKALNDCFREKWVSATVTVECEKADEGYEIVSFTVVGCTDEEKEEIYAYLNKGFNGTPVYFEEGKDG